MRNEQVVGDAIGESERRKENHDVAEERYVKEEGLLKLIEEARDVD